MCTQIQSSWYKGHPFLNHHMFREVPKEIFIGCTSRNKAPTYHHLKDLTSYCKISCLATKELYVEIVGPNSRTKNHSNIRIASLNLWDSPNASIIGLYTIAFGSIPSLLISCTTSIALSAQRIQQYPYTSIPYVKTLWFHIIHFLRLPKPLCLFKLPQLKRPFNNIL